MELDFGEAQATAIALAILFGALLLIACAWNRRTRAGSVEPEDDIAEMHASMVRLRDELPELFNNMNSRLDAKMQALRSLIREASDTANELTLARKRTAFDCPTPPTIPAALPQASDASASQNAVNPAALQPPESADPIGQPIGEVSPQDTAELRQQRYAHVYSLADSGLDPAEIACETGMHRGEVELVLNLRRKRIRMDCGSRSEPAPVVRLPEEAPA
jgi:hypothetical protein